MVPDQDRPRSMIMLAIGRVAIGGLSGTVPGGLSGSRRQVDCRELSTTVGQESVRFGGVPGDRFSVPAGAYVLSGVPSLRDRRSGLGLLQAGYPSAVVSGVASVGLHSIDSPAVVGNGQSVVVLHPEDSPSCRRGVSRIRTGAPVGAHLIRRRSG